MKTRTVFNTIQIPVPGSRILSRLGYHSGITHLNEGQRRKLQTAIEDAAGIIALKGVARRIQIVEKKQPDLLLVGGIRFTSKKLFDFAGNSSELLLMGATAGSAIMDFLARSTTKGNLSGAVVMDAVASEMVDGALDWIMEYYNQLLRRENKQLTKNRFSAGYGDFALENQKYFFKSLGLGSLGVTLTRDYIMLPEKSVTAIAGIRGEE